MLRSFRLDPQAFLDLLHAGGCRLGSPSGQLQYVVNPANPVRSTVVRLDRDVLTDESESHLVNLVIEEADFLVWHERFTSLVRH